MRDEVSAEQPSLTLDPRPVLRPQRPMFGASSSDHDFEPPVGPAEAGRSDGTARGISMWIVAAASLVIGILIGFASGYTAAQPDEPAAAAVEPEAEPAPASVRDSPSGGSTQTFTEDKVERVDPDPIVAGAEPEPAPPRAAAPTAPSASRSTPPAPRSAPPARGRTTRAPSTAERDAPAAEPRAPAVSTAAAEGRGSMEVVSRPAGAQVVLDGLVIGKTPMVLAEVPSGTHSVRLELPGFQRWATSVDVNPGQRTRVAASLEQ